MNENIASTVITDKVRISTAAIFYENWFGNYYQFETIVFSEDKNVGFKMKIHGTDNKVSDRMKKYSRSFHEKLAYKYKLKLTPIPQTH